MRNGWGWSDSEHRFHHKVWKALYANLKSQYCFPSHISSRWMCSAWDSCLPCISGNFLGLLTSSSTLVRILWVKMILDLQNQTFFRSDWLRRISLERSYLFFFFGLPIFKTKRLNPSLSPAASLFQILSVVQPYRFSGSTKKVVARPWLS